MDSGGLEMIMNANHWMKVLAMLALTGAVACGDDSDGTTTPPEDMGDMGGDMVTTDMPTPMGGCTDEDASNFNPAATFDDGTCVFTETLRVDMAGIELGEDGVCFLVGDSTTDCTDATQEGDTSIWAADVEATGDAIRGRFALGGATPTPETVPAACAVEGSSPGIREFAADEMDPRTPVSFNACGALPFFVDGIYSASGFIGDSGNITVDVDDGGDICPTRVDGADGACRRWSYTPGENNFAGVFWQFPDGNFGTMPGYPIPQGTRRISFAAWGAAGGESIEFGFGVGGDVGDPLEARNTITLTTTPTLYSITLPSTPFEDIVTPFLWVAAGDQGPVTFFTDNIVLQAADPGAGCTNPNAANFNAAATSDDGSCEFTFELNVDMSSYSTNANGGGTCGSTDTFTEVFITGNFCGFCVDPGLRLFDEDGDGIYSQTFTFAESIFDINGGTELEFLYMVDGFANQEALLDDVMSGDDACVSNTDGAAFANRGLLPTANPTVLNHTYGRCSACP